LSEKEEINKLWLLEIRGTRLESETVAQPLKSMDLSWKQRWLSALTPLQLMNETK
jgi:hypothetical protein